MLSYLNNKTLKREIVSEMRKHKRNDQIIKGTYGQINGKFKGCAVGCAIHSYNVRFKKSLRPSNHAAFENFGIPEWLARVQDTIFEGLPENDAPQFAVDFLTAIPVGVDLTVVKWKFCAFLLQENIDRVLSLNIEELLKKEISWCN